MTNNLLRELAFYKVHQDELLRQYKGKFLVIKNEVVIDAFDSESDAYQAAREKFELGTFLIQECTPGKESYTQNFHSRVIINNA